MSARSSSSSRASPKGFAALSCLASIASFVSLVTQGCVRKGTGTSTKQAEGPDARSTTRSPAEDSAPLVPSIFPSDGGWQPSDFAVVFPVPFASFAGAKEDDVRRGLDAHLPRLSAFVTPEAYAAMMKAAQGDYPGADTTFESRERNMIRFHVREKLGEDIAEIPLENWRVVAVRFTPCSFFIPVPEPALATGSLRAARDAACHPQVRLTAQPFGLRRVLVSTSPPRTGTALVSDDKTLHLKFDFVGGVAVGGWKAWLDAEAEFRARLDARAKEGEGEVAPDLLAQDLETSHAPARASLTAARTEFLARLKELRGDKPPGRLRLLEGSDADPARVAKVRAWLLGAATKELLPRVVAQNFATSGLKPDTAEQWVFADYGVEVPATDAPLVPVTAVRKRRLGFLAPMPSGHFAPLEIGTNESFSPSSRSRFSLDEGLVERFTRDARVRDGLLGRIPHRTLAKSAPDSAAGLTDEEAERSGVGLNALKGAALFAVKATNDPARSNLWTQPCSACHIAPAVRERLALSGAGEEEVPGNRPKIDLGRPHVDTSFGWNFRQLGYFEANPSIGERLLREIDHDTVYARTNAP